MRILIRSKDTLSGLNGVGSVAVVSISDSPENFPDMPDKCLRVIRQYFHDIESELMDGMFGIERKSLKPFTEAQADEVARLVLTLPDGIETLVFQCHTGISRSAGMAAAVSRHLGYDDMLFFRTYLPNRLVYRMTLEALRRYRV